MTTLNTDVLAANLGAYHGFLDRGVDGIPLTAVGYLKPVDVEAASNVVPAVGDWIGKKNREDLTYLGWSQRDGRPVNADTGRLAEGHELSGLGGHG